MEQPAPQPVAEAEAGQLRKAAVSGSEKQILPLQSAVKAEANSYNFNFLFSEISNGVLSHTSCVGYLFFGS